MKASRCLSKEQVVQEKEDAKRLIWDPFFIKEYEKRKGTNETRENTKLQVKTTRRCFVVGQKGD